MSSILDKHTDEIKKLISKGYSYASIANKVNSNQYTVRQFCKSHNILSRYKVHKKSYPFTEKQVKKLYVDDNLTAYETAKRLNISVGVLRTFIYDKGLTKRYEVPDTDMIYVHDSTRPERIIVKVKRGQVLKLNVAKKSSEDTVITSKEYYKVIDIYPYCVLLAKEIKGKVNMDIRICPSIWELHRMMG
jgi:DNA-binding CsgD family transcriptional regulator